MDLVAGSAMDVRWRTNVTSRVTVVMLVILTCAFPVSCNVTRTMMTRPLKAQSLNEGAGETTLVYVDVRWGPGRLLLARGQHDPSEHGRLQKQQEVRHLRRRSPKGRGRGSRISWHR